MTQQHADSRHDDRSSGHARNGHSQHGQVHQHHPSSHALPHPRARNPSCMCAQRQRTAGHHVSPVTCAPAGGQHAAQCMAACPPPPRGQSGSGAGPCPAPAHHLALGTSICDTSVPPVRAHLDVDVQLHEIYLGRARAGVDLQLRQSEMKKLGRERYTQLRKRGLRALSPICRIARGGSNSCGCTNSSGLRSTR